MCLGWLKRWNEKQPDLLFRQHLYYLTLPILHNKYGAVVKIKMSFGFSIGDIITVSKLANDIRRKFIDSPDQFKAIHNEVKSLSNALRDIEDLLQERDLTDRQNSDLKDIAEGCGNVLTDLEKALGKYHNLDARPKSLRDKSRRVWARLTWEPDDIRDLRFRVTSNIVLLTAFNGSVIGQLSSAIKESVDKLNRHQDDQERRAIINWLTPIDYSAQQSDFLARRQEKTGLWLLDSDEFQRWLNKSKQTLFCPGIPGAGKTMITSIAVDNLCTRFQNDPRVGVAYVYCNYRRQQEQKPADIFASLLKQLIQERPSLPESIRSMHGLHKDRQSRPSFEEILSVLHSIVTDYSRVFVFIDALDEYQASDGRHRVLLSEIFSLQAKTGVSLFATSRFIPEIMKEFEGCISLEIRASEEDVQRYLDGHMSQLPPFISGKPDLQETIKTEITKAVDGMFLLAQLHMDSLIDKPTPGDIKLALQLLPKGSEALRNAYEQAVERIEGQKEGFRKLAKQILSWITLATRPLSTSELQHALATKAGKPELNEEFLPEVEIMISVCAGLVTVDHQSGIIRWVHYTAQEYFESIWASWIPNAQVDITTTCLTYLSFNVFALGHCRTDNEFEARLQSNALYDYAARNWGRHAYAVSTETEQSILSFLGNEAKVSCCSQAMMANASYRGYSQRVPRQVKGMHLVAYFGLEQVVTTLLKIDHHADCRDSYGRTPLSLAAENGHEAVVRLLLTKDGVDPDSEDSKSGLTPLSWAAERGHEAVVRLLLAKDGVDPDSKDSEYSRTPLSWAAEMGHEAVVRLLKSKTQ